MTTIGIPQKKSSSGSGRRSRWRLAMGISLGLIGLLAIALITLLLPYPPEYVWRVLRWGQSDVQDYLRFPARSVEPGPVNFSFREDHDEALVRSLFAEHAAVPNLDEFLAETGTQAFIVIQDDNILYEQYFNGTERDSIVTSFSMGKSFTSALVGAAIADGFIHSVDDPITDYLPELAERDARFRAITIRDLLRMSSGIRYVETGFINGDDATTYYYPDLRSLALNETRIEREPGEVFLYNNFHPLLLGLILERATGMTVAGYLEEKFWLPLGMEYHASWSLDERGFEKMESGINARAIDFARFGRLFLNNGHWQGTQVLPAGWVVESTAPDAAQAPAGYYAGLPGFSEQGGYYRYMWWGIGREDGSYDFTAHGRYGQYIYVSPQKKLIIVRNGEREPVELMPIFYAVASAFPAATQP
jgi:CubicO group peptidase (beta-lactamase class C family)